MDKMNETTIKYYDTDEIYTSLYECSNCGQYRIFRDAKYCPQCGLKIIRRTDMKVYK